MAVFSAAQLASAAPKFLVHLPIHLFLVPSLICSSCASNCFSFLIKTHTARTTRRRCLADAALLFSIIRITVIRNPNHFRPGLTSAPQLPDTFDGPVHLLLMATHTVLAREDRGALIALGTHGGVPGALGPCFVVVPNVTPLLLPIPSISPTAVLFGTASVSGGMFSETKVEQHGSLGGREK